MPGCSIIGCSNSSSKKVRMCRFPVNVERKAAWLDKIKRKDWQPTAHSMICQYHFTDDMWEEPKKGNKLKLKRKAVPTLFGENVKQISLNDKKSEKRKYILLRNQNDPSILKSTVIPDHSYTLPSTLSKEFIVEKKEASTFNEEHPVLLDNVVFIEIENFNLPNKVSLGDQRIFNDKMICEESSPNKSNIPTSTNNFMKINDLHLTEGATLINHKTLKGIKDVQYDGIEQYIDDASIEEMDRNISIMAQDYYNTNITETGSIKKLKKLETVFERSRKMNLILKSRLYMLKRKIQRLESEQRISQMPISIANILR